MKTTIWLTFFISIFFVAESLAQIPFLPKYNAIKRSERCFTITQDINNQFGAVWFSDKGNFGQDTTLYFVVYMGDRDGNGADGLAFVIHDDPRDTIFNGAVTYNIGAQVFNQQAATGDPGGGLGFGDHSSQTQNANLKITPSVGLEFDTWDNGDVQDGRNQGNSPPNSPYRGWDHTAVVYNGDLHTDQQIIQAPDGSFDRLAPLLPVARYGNNANIENDSCYAYKIDWQVNNDGTQTLELFVDNYDPDIIDPDNYNYVPVMSHTDDMINGVFGGETILRFGFTGSTGGSRNEQTICLLGGNTRPTAEDDLASTPINTPVVIDVETNDEDLDGDNLFVPIIVQQAANGFAVVTTVGNDNFIQYTPNTNFVGTDTLRYRTCDVDSDKCYALCDEANVIITVGCDEIFIGADTLANYTLCADTLAPNGAAEAFFVSGTTTGNVWVETFTNMNNATEDTGTTAWSFTTNGGCNGGNNIRVQNDRFRAQNTGCEVIWETGDIDISAVTDVNISMFLEASGDMENADYLRVFYILDGGSEVAFTNGDFTDNFGSATASAGILNGSTLKIRVYARNSAGDENYFWDDIYVTGKGASAPPNLTYSWYEGLIIAPGNFVNNGSTITGLSDTTYSVFAIDQNTGCSSDTISVTIVNESSDFNDTVKVAQLTPFTRCELPYDGSLAAWVVNENGDSTVLGYTFSWFLSGFENPSQVIGVGNILNNLNAQEYKVKVLNQSTGCESDLIPVEVENQVLSPEIIARVLSDAYSCFSDNGILTANATKDGIQLTENVGFLWFNSLGGIDPEFPPPPDFIGDTINNLAPGDYTVFVIDSTTLCPSETFVLNIIDDRQLPVPIVTNATEQTSCDPLAPTGSFTSAVDDGGVLTTNGFTFNWYLGLNNVVPARAGYTSGSDVDSLTADLYRLIVTNDTSGCMGVLDTAIIENIVNPAIANVDSTDVNVCGPGPNGSITITPDGNIADFMYRYYTGNGVVPGNLITESAFNILTGLDVGTYTVTIVDNITKCISPPALIRINDATALPTTNFTVFPQIACNPAPPTGRIEATVVIGTPNDYSFQWFVNDTSGAPVITTRGINGEILDTLGIGTYALLLTNNATLCQNVYFNVIGQSIVLPVVDTAYAISSINCAPNFNGELHAAADGGSIDPLLYTFNWTGPGGVPLAQTVSSILNVSPGNYELVITDNTTLCLSNPYPLTVNDNSITPNAIIDPTDNSSCDVANPNGQLLVSNVTNEGVYNPANYSFEWYIGNSSGTQLVSPNVSFPNTPDSSLVFGISEDTYAMVITNKATNCSNEVLSSIIDINIKPILDFPTITDASNCTDPYMSVVEITTVNGGLPIPAGYNFRLENLNTGDVYTNSTGLFEDLTDLDGIILSPGNYQIIALNSFSCASDTIDFSINDGSVDPSFALTRFNNSSCDVALPNGIVVASTDGSYGINQVEWFITNTSGSNIVPTIPTAAIIRDDTVATGLPGGTYAVRITGDNGCESVEFVSLNDVPSNRPLIDSVYAENLTSCIIVNGLIGLGVSPIEQLPPDLLLNRTYTFSIENSGLGIGPLTLSTDESTNPDTVTFTNLGEGDWEAFVTDEFTNCISDPITITLNEAPIITFSISLDAIPASCNLNTGQITITASAPGSNEPGSGLGFDFSWFNGSSILAPPLLTTVIVNNHTTSANTLSSSYYTLEATDRLSGCVKDTAIFLPSTVPPIIENPITTDPTQCIPPNGELQITVLPGSFPTTPVRDYIDYDFLVFEGHIFDHEWPLNGATEYQVIDGTSVGDPVNGPVDFISNFGPGTYVIVAKEKFGQGCFTDPKIVNYELDYQFPATDFDIVADRTCPGAADGTGSIEETLLNHPDYDFEWYTGSSIATGSPIGITSEIINDQLSNTYSLWIEVTNGPGLGCDTVRTVQIPKVLDELELIATETPNFNCDPNYNGIIEITDVLINTVSSGLGGFTGFTINDNNNVDITGITLGDGTITPWNSLAPETYYLSARNIVTNCVTDLFKADIDDDSQTPILNIVMDSPDYSCNNVMPTGQLTATANPIPGIAYTWQWTNSLGNPVASVDAPNTSVVSNIQDDVYSLLVTDNDGDGINEGCSSSRVITLTQGSVSIVTPTVSFTDRTICDDNASISVDQIDERRNGALFNSESAPYATYEGILFDNSLTAINTGTFPWATFQSANGRFGATDMVPVGRYYVKSRNISTGCNFGPPTQVIIKDVSKNPIVDITMLTPDFSCAPGATPTGELFANAFGGSDADNNQGNFLFTWTDISGTIPPVNDPLYTQLAEGTYEVTITDNSSLDRFCETTRTFQVTHALQEIVIVDVGGTDQTWCNPNGTFYVEGLQINDNLGSRIIYPADAEFANYTINIFENNLTNLVQNGLAVDTINNLNSTTFFAIASNNTTLCESFPRQFIINDISEDPIIDLNKLSDNYSLNYVTPLSLTGILEAETFEGDGATTASGGYYYTWYKNEVNTDSIFFTDGPINGVQTLSNLRDALYLVEVESDSTGCVSTAALDLPFVYLKPKFVPIPTAQTTCVPPNGNIVINSIYKVPDSTETFNKYLFDWHVGDYDKNNPDSVKAGSNNGNRLDGLPADDYYVQALDTWWLVESDPVQVIVEDNTVFPVINYNNAISEDQRSCNPAFPNGALGVNVLGFDTYNYEWYDGPSATGSVISMTNSILNQDAGPYTIVVTFTTTGCATNKLYDIKENIVLPILTASTSPVTNCIPALANGIANSTVVNISSSYDFYWYNGTSDTGTPAFTDLAGVFPKTNSAYVNISKGFYTVVAQDTFDCKSDPLTIEVKDALVYPAISVQELSPLTYCDPLKPNAAMSALADGMVAGYNFQWNIKNGPIHASGPVVNNLSDLLYTLIVTNSATGCMSLRDVRPTVAYKNIPDPIVDILSDMSSCISPNGIAISSILGKLEDYMFTYLDNNGFNPITDNINGTTISELDFDDYFVFATDRISGCISDSVIFTIKDTRYFPEFDIITEPSICNESTGSGEVVIADFTRDFEVRWFTEGRIDTLGTGRSVFYQPSGQYLVEVEGTEGCFSEADVFIGTDIIIYNGVSDNDDGLNEAFYIECIYLFPDNNVKIFNRAGEMVYEMEDYDSENPERSFTGLSNRGPINGNNVAIGTYFYVIDLKDGSKPRVGYLELIR